jgi:hypothetical protein
LAIAAALTASGVDFYVAPNGDDANPGAAKSFASLRPPDPPRKKRGEEWNEKEPVAGAN